MTSARLEAIAILRRALRDVMADDGNYIASDKLTGAICYLYNRMRTEDIT